MSRLKVPPTKSTLLDLRKHMRMLEQGYDLLERKREILTRLVYERLKFYRQLRKAAREALKESYHWLGISQMRIGSRMMRQIALGLKPALQVKILPRSNLGVEYPSVKVKTLPLQPVGLLWRDASCDECRQHMAQLVSILARLGEAELSLLRMLADQRKTKKRVNALKYNVIPKYKETIRFIESNLEEEERNTLFQIKILRGE